MQTIRCLAGFLAFLCLPGSVVNAAEASSPFVRMSIAPGMSRGSFVARTVSVFDRLDADGDGFLDAADALDYGRAQAAQARAANAGRLLAFDLDGDARIDLRELVAGLRAGLALPEALTPSVDPQGAEVAGVAAAAMASLDRDADGRITVAEMLAVPVAEVHVNPVSAFLDAFPTAGGRLGKGAFVQGMLAQAFDRADRDRDGVLSREEVEAVQRQ